MLDFLCRVSCPVKLEILSFECTLIFFVPLIALIDHYGNRLIKFDNDILEVDITMPEQLQNGHCVLNTILFVIISLLRSKVSCLATVY